MTQDQSGAGRGSGPEKSTGEGNALSGSPTFPNPSTARPTGDTTGFNGSYTETEHHTQREYDAENQQNEGDSTPRSSEED